MPGLALANACVWNVTTGSSGNWNTAGSWTSCGGTVPQAADTVTFNSGKSGDCVFNADAAIASLTINGYTGTISKSGTRTLTISGAFSQSSGTYQAAGLLEIGTTLTLSGGTFSAAEQVQVGTNFSQSGGTYDIASASNGVGSALIVGGNFTVSAGTFGGPFEIVVGGNFSYQGGSFTTATGPFYLAPTASGTVTHTFGGATFTNIVIGDAMPVVTGLLGYWKLDNNGNDSSGNSYTLTQSGTGSFSAVRLAPLRFANGYGYATSSGSYYYHDTLTATRLTSWTLSGWFKDTAAFPAAGTGCGDGTGAAEVVHAGGGDYFLRVCNAGGGTGVLTAHATRTTGTTDICTSSNTFSLNDNNWHHAAATRSGSSLIVYLDGVRTACTAGGTQNATGQKFRIGAAPDTANYNFPGRLDDVRVYSRALTGPEVLAIAAGAAGASPGSGTVTHSASGAVTINGDLSLGQGILTGTSAISLKGSWLNLGGYYTGTGDVSLTGTATGKSILSNSQRFASLTLNGTGGAWTLADRLWVTGRITITAGTLATGGYVVHAGTLRKASGAGAVFTHGSSTLVLDSSSDQIVVSDGSLNNVRAEDPTETGLLGYWKLDEAFGTTARDVSGNDRTGTLAGTSALTWKTSDLNDRIDFDNPAALTYSGAGGDQRISFTSPAAHDKITVSAWIYVPNSGTAGENNPRIVELPYFRFFVSNRSAASPNRIGVYSDRSSGTDGNWQTANNSFSLDAWHHVAVTYDGATLSNDPIIYLDGATVSLTTSDTNPTMAAYNSSHSTGLIGNSVTYVDDFAGHIDDVRIYNDVLTATEITALYNGGYPGRGGTAAFTLQANTTVSGSSASDSGTLQTVYRAYDDAATAGTVEGFPTASFSWADYSFNGTYVLYNNVNGGSTDKLYKRDTNGAAQAEWSLPTNGNFVGAPKWTHDGGSPGTYYVYVIDANGNAYKLQDNGSSFTQSSTYRDGSNATATSPLAADTTNIYWLGNQGAAMSTPMLFRLPQATFTSPGSVGATANNGAVATIATVSGSSYVFFANGTKLYRTDVTNLGTPTASTFSNANGVYGRVTVQNNVIYYVDNAGTLFAANPSDLSAATWSYHDNTNHNGCAAGGTCAAKNLFADFTQGRVFFGDADGHVYAIDTTTQTTLANYPFRPGTSSDVFEAAPLYRSGVLLFGTTAGKVYLIDQKSNAMGAPALISTFNFGAAVSTISWDFDGSQYMVGTNNGTLFYISQVSDPTSSYN